MNIELGYNKLHHQTNTDCLNRRSNGKKIHTDIMNMKGILVKSAPEREVKE